MRRGFDKPIEIYDLSNDVAEAMDLAKEREDLVAQAERIFRAAHRPDPNWPLDRRADLHRQRSKEAWAVKRQRDRTKWVPPNAIRMAD